MKSHRMSALLATSLLAVLALCPLARGQSKVWVSSADARIQADKTASSATVETLSVGTELTVLSYQSPWYEVSTASGTRGWIYRGKVSTSPPQTEQQGGGGLFSALPGSGIQSQSADTSRSIRGLSPEATAYAQETNQPLAHREALDRVLDMSVSDSEVEGFLKEGRIGEYAQ